MKCRILCPSLLIDSSVDCTLGEGSGNGDSSIVDAGECCVNEFANVMICFEHDTPVAELYMSLCRGDEVELHQFGIIPLDTEIPAVIQSEFNLRLTRCRGDVWHLARTVH